jgi:hypothetical protein
MDATKARSMFWRRPDERPRSCYPDRRADRPEKEIPMKIGFKQVILSSALAAVITPAALAQSTDNPFERGRWTAVTERPQPDFDPPPVRAGAFEILSSAGLAAELNSNVFATDTGEVSDTILRFTPQIEARSNWNVHALTAGFALNHNEHLDVSTETSTDYNAFLDGRLDVQRTFHLTGRLDAAHITEPRYEPANDGAEPSQYDRFGIAAGAVFQTDRLQLRATFGSNDINYDTGGVNRDFTETFMRGRASFAFSPDVAVFAQASSSEQDYTDNTRDGERYSYEAGVSFELQSPLRGEIAVGTVTEDKNLSPDLEGLSLDAQIEWFPTQLTTVTFRGTSEVFDPGLPNSFSALRTVYGARVDHEFYRNVLLFGDGSFGSYDYEGINRQDDFSDFAFGLAWKLNRHARLEGEYRIHNTESTGTLADPFRTDASQNIFSIGIRVYP